MAIACKICNKELDVFSGGRCRKCRQLVCGDCMASGGVSNAKGLLCKICAAAEKSNPTPEPETTVISNTLTADNTGSTVPLVDVATTRRRFPLWVIAPIAAAAIIFAVIIGYPRFQIWRNLNVLKRGEDPAAVIAIDQLGRYGSKWLFEKLCALVEQTPDPARSRAVRVLGKIPLLEARDYLLELQEKSKFESVAFRAVIIEALRDHERRDLPNAQ